MMDVIFRPILIGDPHRVVKSQTLAVDEDLLDAAEDAQLATDVASRVTKALEEPAMPGYLEFRIEVGADGSLQTDDPNLVDFVAVLDALVNDVAVRRIATLINKIRNKE